MRKRSLKLLILLPLAGVGFAAGQWLAPFPKSAELIPRPKTDDAGISTWHDRQDPPDFSSSLPRLRELAYRGAEGWNFKAVVEGRRQGQDELELEAIFALATREDLIAWFAEEETAKASDAALNAAYTRLASLSLDEAIGIWTDQQKRTGNAAGVDGLIRVWAETDPSAAEAWVLQLTDRNAKRIGLHALLDTVVEVLPDLVERHLVEHGNAENHQWVFESIHLVTRLAKVVPPERLSILANRILAEKRGKWEYQNQLRTLLAIWGERDTPAMMSWLLAQPPGELQDHVIPHVVESLEAKDPAALLARLEPLMVDNKTVAKMAGGTWLNWLSGENSDAAMKWFEDHGGKIQLDPQMLWRGRSWTTEEAQRVLSRLADLPEGETKTTIAKATLQQLSLTDPKVALDYFGALLPAGQDTDWLIASTLSGLARKGEPSDALAWAMENLGEGQGKNDAVRLVMSSWTEVDPLEAAKNAGSLSGKLRDEAYSGIAYQWVENSTEQMLGYLENSTNPLEGELAKNGFWNLGFHRSSDAFLARALALPNEALRSQAVEGYFGGWSRANLESSGESLIEMERGPMRDTAVAAFVSNARWTDREAAVTWSLDITGEQKRREVTMQQCRYWLNADREAALQWIKTSAKLPEDWRAELLKPKN